MLVRFITKYKTTNNGIKRPSLPHKRTLLIFHAHTKQRYITQRANHQLYPSLRVSTTSSYEVIPSLHYTKTIETHIKTCCNIADDGSENTRYIDSQGISTSLLISLDLVHEGDSILQSPHYVGKLVVNAIISCNQA